MRRDHRDLAIEHLTHDVLERDERIVRLEHDLETWRTLAKLALDDNARLAQQNDAMRRRMQALQFDLREELTEAA